MSTKTCDLDPLLAKLLSECIDKLLPAITDIINTSLSSGIFPTLFKSAVVRRRPASTLMNSRTSELYRICPSPNCSNKLYSNRSMTTFLPTTYFPNLSAYRPRHSTESALLRITSDLLNASDRGEVSAFVLPFFRTYLQNRFQSVLNNTHSSPVKLTCGVPQGSVLGPVLFTFIPNPLPQSLSTTTFTITLSLTILNCMIVQHMETYTPSSIQSLSVSLTSRTG